MYTVCVAQVPLADAGTRVVAQYRRGQHPIHVQNAAANVLPVKGAADACLLHLDFPGPKKLG